MPGRERRRAVIRSLDFRARQAVNRVRAIRADPPCTAAALARLAEEAGSGPPGSAPVFVLGAGWRTGSTLVQRLLNGSGEMLVWGEPFGEGAVVQRLAETMTFLDPTRGRFHGRILADEDAVPDEHSWTANMTPPLSHLLASQRSALDRLLGEPARAHGFARWGVKEVVWGRDVITLLTLLYPDARFLLLVRDPRTQWRSYRPTTRRPWYYRWPDRPVGSPLTFGRLWCQLVEDFLDVDQEHAGATIVRYESLGDGTELERISRFVGLASPLTPHVSAVGSSREKSYFTDSVPAWENALIGRVTARAAHRLGYA